MPVGDVQRTPRAHHPNPPAADRSAGNTSTRVGRQTTQNAATSDHSASTDGRLNRDADSFEIVPVHATQAQRVDTSGAAIVRGLMHGAGGRPPEATMRILTRELGTGPGMLAVAAEVTPGQVRSFAVAEGASPAVAEQIAERFVETTRHALHTAVVDAAATRAAEVRDDLRARQHPSTIVATTEALVAGQDDELLQRMRGAGIGAHLTLQRLQTEYAAASTPQARAAVLAQARPVVAAGLREMEQLVARAAEDIPRIYAQDSARQLEEFFPGANRRVLRNAGLTAGRIRMIGSGAGGSVLEEGAARAGERANAQRGMVRGADFTLRLVRSANIPLASQAASTALSFANTAMGDQELTARSMAAATGDGSVRAAELCRRATYYRRPSR